MARYMLNQKYWFQEGRKTRSWDQATVVVGALRH